MNKVFLFLQKNIIRIGDIAAAMGANIVLLTLLIKKEILQ